MKKALKYILPVAMTVLLVWLLFRKVNFAQTMQLMSHGVRYEWILAGMGISVFSHIFRAMRWRIQFNALRVPTTLMEVTCSIFGCYALNLLLPRIGELWRCSFIAHRSGSPFTTVMGSMVADRLMDTVMVLLITLLTFVVAAPALAAFMARYPVGTDMLRLLSNPLFWLAGAAALVVAILIFRRYRHSKAIAKLRGWVAEMWRGFAVVVTMPGRWRFLLLTLGIWGCYFFQLYVAFYAFGFTRALCSDASLAYGLVPCLVAFVFSSIGMAIPSNGGLGPWNIAIVFGLAIYGVADVEGTAFSIVVWSGQTLMLILLGIFAAVYSAISPAAKLQSKQKELHL